MMAYIPYRATATRDFKLHEVISIHIPLDAKPTDPPIPEAHPYIADIDEGVNPVGIVAIPARKGEIVLYFRRDDMLKLPGVIDLGNIPHDLDPDIYLKEDE